jgi:hypothetical protein
MSKIFIALYLRDAQHMSNNFSQFTDTKFDGYIFSIPQTVSCIQMGKHNGIISNMLGYKPIGTNVLKEIAASIFRALYPERLLS